VSPFKFLIICPFEQNHWVYICIAAGALSSPRALLEFSTHMVENPACFRAHLPQTPQQQHQNFYT
jgi:hypothetical protein